MDFLIITGLSGAGKSRAADVLEDLDYYCVDNLPIALMPRFAELCIATGGRYEKVALVTDVRAKNSFNELISTIDQLKEMNCDVRILYMDADVPVIVRRYKETRRPHPLAVRGGSIEDAVNREIELLAAIKARADFIVNTSTLTLGALQHRLFDFFAADGRKRDIDVTVMSTASPWMQTWSLTCAFCPILSMWRSWAIRPALTGRWPSMFSAISRPESLWRRLRI